MAKIIPILLMASASLMMTGCFTGQSSISASNYSGAPYEIYANGKHICTMRSGNDCSIGTRGSSDPIYIEAFKDGTVVGSIRISRHVTPASILWVPFTYASSFWLYRAFPDDIEIPIDRNALKANSPDDGISVWDKPYHPKKKDTEKPVVLQAEDNEDLTTEENVEEAEPTPVRKKKSVWD